MRSLRRVVFYVFLFVYLVAAPTAILYALGYIFAPGSERSLVRSGLIALASTPDDAQVFLGNSRYTRRTPTVIRDLLPGTYALRLTRRDCESWQSEVRVQAERAAVLDRVILLPANRAPRRASDLPWSDLRPEPGEKQVLLINRERLDKWAVLDAGEGLVRPLIPTNSAWTGARVVQHWLQQDSPHALLLVRAEDRESYLWFTLDEKDEEPLEVTRLFPETPDEVTWDPREHHEIYARVGSRVHRLDLKEKAIYPDCAPPAHGIALRRNRLFVLDASNALVRVEHDGETERASYRVPRALAQQLKEQRYTLNLLPDDLLLLLGAGGSLWVNHAPWELVQQNVKAVTADEESDRWLVATDHALGLLEPKEGEKGQELALRWIHEQASPIDRVAWIHDGTHLVFSSLGQLWLLPLERGGGGPPRFLENIHRNGAFYFSERSGELYFLDAEQRLARIHLLPPRSLIPLPLHAEERE